jgi:hypothetical protein
MLLRGKMCDTIFLDELNAFTTTLALVDTPQGRLAKFDAAMQLR